MVCFDEQKHQKGIALPLTHRHRAQPNRLPPLFLAPLLSSSTKIVRIAHEIQQTRPSFCAQTFFTDLNGGSFLLFPRALAHFLSRITAVQSLPVCREAADRCGGNGVEGRTGSGWVGRGGGGGCLRWENPRSHQKASRQMTFEKNVV